MLKRLIGRQSSFTVNRLVQKSIVKSSADRLRVARNFGVRLSAVAFKLNITALTGSLEAAPR